MNFLKGYIPYDPIPMTFWKNKTTEIKTRSVAARDWV